MGVEALGPDLLTVFANGCCGDINHVDPRAKDRNNTEVIGRAIGASVKRALPERAPLVAPNLATASAKVRLPLQRFSPEKLGWAKDDATELFEMRGAFTTVYIRHLLEVADPATIGELVLTVRVDDGFVAYLNGSEVGRSLAGAPGDRVAFDRVAQSPLTDAEERDVRVDPRLLENGVNILAIQGLNSARGSSDLSLIPSLKAKRRPDPSTDQRLLESFRAAATGEGAAERIAYLEARALERKGRQRDAVRLLSEIVERNSDPIEPLLALARCLRDAGDPAGAAARLREALQANRAGGRAAWDAWLSLLLVDLARTPAEVFAELSSMSLASGAGGHADDLLWLLERLKDGQDIRIDCGGDDRVVQGVAWGRDRFAEGGCTAGERLGPPASTMEQVNPRPLLRGEVADTQIDDVYRGTRTFPSFQLRIPAYRIPLPRGAYPSGSSLRGDDRADAGKLRIRYRPRGEDGDRGPRHVRGGRDSSRGLARIPEHPRCRTESSTSSSSLVPAIRPSRPSRSCAGGPSEILAGSGDKVAASVVDRIAVPACFAMLPAHNPTAVYWKKSTDMPLWP